MQDSQVIVLNIIQVGNTKHVARFISMTYVKDLYTFVAVGDYATNLWMIYFY